MSKNKKDERDWKITMMWGFFIVFLVIVFLLGVALGLNKTSKSIDPEIYCSVYDVNKDKLGDNFTDKDLSLFARDVYMHHMNLFCKRNCSEQELVFGNG